MTGLLSIIRVKLEALEVTMTQGEILEAIRLLDAWGRQAHLSIGSWRGYFWRIEHQDERYVRYPAPWHVDPAESMAETYTVAANTLWAVFTS